MFPIDLDHRPNGYEPLKSEPEFNPSAHLALEEPVEIYSLYDLGYDEEAVFKCPSDFGASSIFRVLSAEGVACLYDVLKQMEEFATSNPRIERCLRGGVYRSKFLRDMCLSPDITAFMSKISGIELMPHTIPHQLGHTNFNPSKIGEDVDKWHVDTLRYDYVMFVTDPKSVKGGAFQYFKGTKEEMAELKANGQQVPADKIVAPEMPGPGYAIMQQGNMVVHQAKGLLEPGERITLVNGYFPVNPTHPDYSRYDQLIFADPADVVTPEFLRHTGLYAQRMIDQQLSNLTFTDAKVEAADSLEKIAAILSDAAAQIRSVDSAKMEHFGE